MSEIPLDKFIELCETVQATHKTVEKMDLTLDEHTLDIRDLQNHNINLVEIRKALTRDREKRFKNVKLWLGIPSVVLTIFGVLSWVLG